MLLVEFRCLMFGLILFFFFGLCLVYSDGIVIV